MTGALAARFVGLLMIHGSVTKQWLWVALEALRHRLGWVVAVAQLRGRALSPPSGGATSQTPRPRPQCYDRDAVIQRLHGCLVVGAVLWGCGPNVAVSQGEGGTDEPPASTGEGVGVSTGGSIPPLECDPVFDSALPRGEEIWTQVFPSAGRANALALAVSPSGQTVAVGSQDEEHLAHNGWLLQLSSEGDLLREEVRDLEEVVEFEDVALLSGGDAVVVGVEGSGDDERRMLYRFSADGTQLWSVVVPYENDPRWGSRITTSLDGRILVGVGVGLSDNTFGVELLEFSATGELHTTLVPLADDVGDPEFHDVGFDRSGRLYSAGNGMLGDAKVEWVRRWGPDGAPLPTWTSPDWGTGWIELGPLDDGLLVLGVDYARMDPPYVVRPRLRRYDDAGNELWTRVVEMDELGDDVLSPWELATDCLGRSWIFASHSPVGGGINRWLFLHDQDGVELDRFLIETESSAPSVRDLATDPFGNLVLALDRDDASGGAFLVRKLAR